MRFLGPIDLGLDGSKLEMVILERLMGANDAPLEAIDAFFEEIEPSLEVPTQQEPPGNHHNCIDQNRQLVTKPEDIAARLPGSLGGSLTVGNADGPTTSYRVFL